MERTIRIDDIDGTTTHDVQPVRIAVDDTEWTIDLSADNRARLTQVLAPFTDHARRTSPPKRPRITTAEKQRRKDIRAWAAAQGIPLSTHGRIPTDVSAQYDQDHPHE